MREVYVVDIDITDGCDIVAGGPIGVFSTMEKAIQGVKNYINSLDGENSNCRIDSDGYGSYDIRYPGDSYQHHCFVHTKQVPFEE